MVVRVCQIIKYVVNSEPVLLFFIFMSLVVGGCSNVIALSPYNVVLE